MVEAVASISLVNGHKDWDRFSSVTVFTSMFIFSTSIVPQKINMRDHF